MARAGSHFAWLSAALMAAACSAPGPPEELSGLWSAGSAACAAGVGVRFSADAIEAVYDRDVQVLFERPRYRVEDSGERFRVRVVYDLPSLPGGARAAGARGVLVLSRQRDGGIAAVSHTLLDARTGAARMRIADDPAMSALALQPCGPHPWGEALRGRA
jgi:hypothetical protein